MTRCFSKKHAPTVKTAFVFRVGGGGNEEASLLLPSTNNAHTNTHKQLTAKAAAFLSKGHWWFLRENGAACIVQKGRKQRRRKQKEGKQNKKKTKREGSHDTPTGEKHYWRLGPCHATPIQLGFFLLSSFQVKIALRSKSKTTFHSKLYKKGKSATHHTKKKADNT